MVAGEEHLLFSGGDWKTSLFPLLSVIQGLYSVQCPMTFLQIEIEIFDLPGFSMHNSLIETSERKRSWEGKSQKKAADGGGGTSPIQVCRRRPPPITQTAKIDLKDTHFDIQVSLALTSGAEGAFLGITSRLF